MLNEALVYRRISMPSGSGAARIKGKLSIFCKMALAEKEEKGEWSVR